MINLMLCGNSKVYDGILIALLSISKHTDEPFVGFAISFPHTNTSFAGVEYTANMGEEFAATEDAFEEENDNEYNDD